MFKKITLYLTVLMLFGSFVTAPYDRFEVFAQDAEEVEDLTDDIEELVKKISELQKQGKTLANEIAYFDGQISLTQLRIQNAISEIDKRNALLEELTEDIADLEVRIDNLAESIDYQTKILEERMRARYKAGTFSPIAVIFGSDTFSTIVKKTEYLKIMQLQDQRLLAEMKDTKDAYITQKNLFEEKKEQTEQLKAEVEVEKRNLEIYKSNLDSQRLQKEALLEQTQNDESKYQEQLAKARAQLEAIQSIVATVDFKDGVDVDKGDIIAVMGNSGYPDCSTGPHLHLEIRKDGNVKNPESYLESKNVYTYDYNSGDRNIGSGDWDWPMKDPVVNQRFGDTPWSWRYPSGFHDGLDMESNNTFIYAPEDGKLVKGSMGCYSSVVNYAAIDHGDDVISYYLHIK